VFGTKEKVLLLAQRGACARLGVERDRLFEATTLAGIKAADAVLPARGADCNDSAKEETARRRRSRADHLP